MSEVDNIGRVTRTTARVTTVLQTVTALWEGSERARKEKVPYGRRLPLKYVHEEDEERGAEEEGKGRNVSTAFISLVRGGLQNLLCVDSAELVAPLSWPVL